jgi:hypothetical protein
MIHEEVEKLQPTKALPNYGLEILDVVGVQV